MEKILNDNEKIRKAENIYYRRNNINRYVKETEKKGYLKTKVLLHMLIMLNIAIIVISVQNRDFIFSKSFLENISKYNLKRKEKIVDLVGEIVVAENEEDLLLDQDTQDATNENIMQENNSEKNIYENSDIVEEKKDVSSISEMELDINNLKNYSFIKPIEGMITSHFGSRVSTYKNVTGYHTGTDIGAEKGTVIKASMEGIVTQVSSEGDYGKHIKIRCNNVTTLYAHCSKIYVKEGQIIAQGQAIGEVGSTGNSTGPHLHFEIRIDDNRFVDPEEILL